MACRCRRPGGFATVRDPKTGRAEPRGFRTGVAHEFTLRYDPTGNAGGGTVTLTLGGETSVCHLAKGHKADGKEMGKLSFSEMDVQELGPDTAMARARWKLVTSKETFEGLFTLILRKFPDGWKIVHDHTSKADPPKK